jgi:hypothetical protein
MNENMNRVGHIHIYIYIYMRCIYGIFGQGNHKIYGYIWCIYMVLANPIYEQRGTDTLNRALAGNVMLSMYAGLLSLGQKCNTHVISTLQGSFNDRHVCRGVEPWPKVQHKRYYCFAGPLQ